MFSQEGEEFSAEPLQRVGPAGPPSSCGCQGQVSHWAVVAAVNLTPRFSALSQPARTRVLEEQGFCLHLELDRIHGLKLNVFILFVFFYSIWTEGSHQHHLQMPK